MHPGVRSPQCPSASPVAGLSRSAPRSQNTLYEIYLRSCSGLPLAKPLYYTSSIEHLLSQITLICAKESHRTTDGEAPRAAPRWPLPAPLSLRAPFPTTAPLPSLSSLLPAPFRKTRPVMPLRRKALATLEGEIKVHRKAPKAPSQPQTRYRGAASPPPSNRAAWNLPTQEKGERCPQDFTSDSPFLIHRSAPRAL